MTMPANDNNPFCERTKLHDHYSHTMLVGNRDPKAFLSTEENFKCGAHVLDPAEFRKTTPRSALCDQLLKNLIHYGNSYLVSNADANRLFIDLPKEDRDRLHRLRLNPADDFAQHSHLVVMMLSVLLCPLHMPKLPVGTTWQRKKVKLNPSFN